MTDKYQKMRETGHWLVNYAVGKTVGELARACEDAGFTYRYLHIDTKACMITADVRMDRIGISTSKGIVIAASVG